MPPNKDRQATQKQIEFMRKLDLSVPENCTVKQASLLIGSALSQRNTEAEKREEEAYVLAYVLKEKQIESNPFWVAHTDCNQASKELEDALNLIKKEASETNESNKAAKKRIAELKKEEAQIVKRMASLGSASLESLKVELEKIREDIEEQEYQIDDSKPDVKGETECDREHVKEMERTRVVLWKVSFVKEMVEDWPEELEGDYLNGYPVLQNVYEEVACLFKQPPVGVIKEILKNLDAENETWDRDNPMLFFERLAAWENGKYRDLKQARKKSQAKKASCFNLIIGVAVLILIIVFAVIVLGILLKE
jgi:hypothetical protein